MITRLVVLMLLVSAVTAAETAVESADHFWRLPLPEGWSELKLTEAMKGRIRGQAMIQSGDTKLSIIVAVRPDGREDPAIDTVFVTQFLDGFIVESRQGGSKYTRSEVTLIDWDGLPAGEATAVLNDGDADKAVIFRVLAANGFVYTLRAVEERAEAASPGLKAALDAFRLTKKPEPKAPVTETSGEAAAPTAGSNGVDDGGLEAKAEAPAPTGDKTALIVIAIIAGVGIVVAIAFPFVFKKKKSSRRRGRGGTSRIERQAAGVEPGDGGPRPSQAPTAAARRPTVRMDPAQQAKAQQRDSQRRPTVVSEPGRRTTVRMPDAAPKPPTTTKRRRPPG